MSEVGLMNVRYLLSLDSKQLTSLQQGATSGRPVHLCSFKSICGIKINIKYSYLQTYMHMRNVNAGTFIKLFTLGKY